MKVSDPEKTVVRIEFAPSTIGWLLATAAALWLLHQLWELGLLLLVALIFAGTINPLVMMLERRGLKRSWSLVLLFFGSISLVSLGVFLAVPPLAEQLTLIVHTAPEHRQHLIAFLSERSLTEPLARAVQSAGLEQMFAGIENYLLGYSAAAVRTLGYFGTAVVMALYLLTDGKRAQGVLYAVVPRHYHMRLARIIDNLEAIVGGYMRGQLITSASIATFTFLLLSACRVHNALSLALFAGLADVIPFVGGLLAGGFAVLSTLPRGMPLAITVLVSMTLYMQFENRLLVPRIYGHVLRLSPIAVVLALLAGGTLLGMMGALLSLPVAAGLQMILEELRVELPGDDSDDRLARARHEKTEATYERMSAGATAPEAGHIARTLAHEIRDADAAKEAK